MREQGEVSDRAGAAGADEGEGGDERRALDLVLGFERGDRERDRLRAIQELLATEGSNEYSRVQLTVAERLGISVRSVQRMMKAWREEGLRGVVGRVRSDRGERRISEEWQAFIIETYRAGNRGGRVRSRAQVVERVKIRVRQLGLAEYPSHMTVYRILEPFMPQEQVVKRSLGWQGGRLVVKTREGIELSVEYSNQVWQVDHTKVDVLVVDSAGDLLGRPWLTIVVDMHSRCIMGMHLGFEAPSASVVCLALRHAILAKQYPASYELEQSWGTYGLPQYLYTDSGKDFKSQHIEQVAMELGIVMGLRRKPSDGGIVERPFGTFNSELFGEMQGYTGSNVQERSPFAEREAGLTLTQLEQLIVRYIVDRYNQQVDARTKTQTRLGLWESGQIGQLPLLGKRDLDICLMRRERRTVYRSGYIQFANLTYQGEHLAGYAGACVIVRYDPRDITTIWIYQLRNGKEEFLTRAHAQGLETEILSYGEAQALSRRIRESGQAVSPRSVLNEVRDRDAKLLQLRRAKQRKQKESQQRHPPIERNVNLDEFNQEEVKIGNEALLRTAIETPTGAMTESQTERIKEQSIEPMSEAAIDGNGVEEYKPQAVRVYWSYEEIALRSASESRRGARTMSGIDESDEQTPEELNPIDPAPLEPKRSIADQQQLDRLQQPCVVELARVQQFHAWLEQQRRGRRSCPCGWGGANRENRSVSCLLPTSCPPPRARSRAPDARPLFTRAHGVLSPRVVCRLAQPLGIPHHLWHDSGITRSSVSAVENLWCGDGDAGRSASITSENLV